MMENILQKLCGLLTKHRHNYCSVPFQRETGRTEWYCCCRLCHYQFWTDERPKNAPECDAICFE